MLSMSAKRRVALFAFMEARLVLFFPLEHFLKLLKPLESNDIDIELT